MTDTYKFICKNCKIEKLNQIGVKMSIGIGYCKMGTCDFCNKNNNELYSYKETLGENSHNCDKEKEK